MFFCNNSKKLVHKIITIIIVSSFFAVSPRTKLDTKKGQVMVSLTLLLLLPLLLLLLLSSAKLTHASKWGSLNPGARALGCYLQYSNNSAILIAGQDASQNTLTDIHLQNLDTFEWTWVTPSGGAQPAPRVSPVCFAYNGEIYMFGGQSLYGSQSALIEPLSDFWKFNPTILQYTKLIDLGLPTTFATGVVIGHTAVVFGGANLPYQGTNSSTVTSPCTSKTLIYDISSNAWTDITNAVIGSIPPARCLASMRAVPGTTKAILMMGMPENFNEQEYLTSDVWQFDLSNYSWSNINPASVASPIPRFGALLTCNNQGSLLYLEGGANYATELVYNVEIFNLTSSQWITPNNALNNPQAILWNGGFWLGNNKRFAYGFNADNEAQAQFSLLDTTITPWQYSDLNIITNNMIAVGIQPTFYASLLDAENNQWWLWGGTQMGNYANTLQNLTQCDLLWSTCNVVNQYGQIPTSTIGLGYWSSTLTLVSPGKAILVGGLSGNFLAYNLQVYLFELATQTWSIFNTDSPSGLSPMLPYTTNSALPQYAIGVADHVSGFWGNTIWVYGGQTGCCNYGTQVWALNFTNTFANATWIDIPINGPTPSYYVIGSGLQTERYGHTAQLIGHEWYIHGGANNSPPFPDLWIFNLITWMWTLVNPDGELPPARVFHSSVLLADGTLFCIFGGQGNGGLTLSDMWCYSPSSNQWTEITVNKLDSDSDINFPANAAAYGLRAVASPLSGGDTTVFFGPGTQTSSTGAGTYLFSRFTLGIHNIFVSNTLGSDVKCQLNLAVPCNDLSFALDHFASSFKEFTVSADLQSTITLTSATTIASNMQISSPLIIQGSIANSVLDCNNSICFQLTDITSNNAFTLQNLVLQNGANVNANGGLFIVSDSYLQLTNCILKNGNAINGGAIYAQGNSILEISGTSFDSNYASSQGGAIFLDIGTSCTIYDYSRFYKNTAGKSGGAMTATASNLLISQTQFIENRVLVTTNSNGFLSGGALSIIVSKQTIISNCLFTDNNVIVVPGLSLSLPLTNNAYGGAIFLYSSVAKIYSTIFTGNSANSGGALASLSVSEAEAQILGESSILQMYNSTMQTNHAQAFGGACYFNNVQLVTVSQSTFFNNSATSSYGGGIVAMTSNLQVNETKFISNVCWQGNGGSLALLGSSSLFGNDCFFNHNASPMGGGGVAYIGPDSATSTQSIQPIFTASTIFGNNNVGSYGNKFATPPVSLVIFNLSQIANIYQSAGMAIDPFPGIDLKDEFKNIVSNLPVFVTASVVNSSLPTTYENPLLGGQTIVESVNGRITFDNLIILSLPNTSLTIIFQTTLPQQFGNNLVLSSETVTLTTSLCMPPSSYYNVEQGICGLCAYQHITTAPMQTTCQFHFHASQPLDWIASWLVAIGGIIAGAAIMATMISKIKLYLKHMYHEHEKTPWMILTMLILAYGTWPWVQGFIMIQSITPGAYDSGVFEAITTQFATAYFICCYPVTLFCSLGIFAIQYIFISSNENRKLIKKESAEEKAEKQKNNGGDSAVALLEMQSAKKRSENENTVERSKIESVSGNGTNSFNSKSSQGSDFVSIAKNLDRPDQRTAVILKHITALDELDQFYFGLIGILASISTVATVGFVLVGSSQYSQWFISPGQLAWELTIAGICCTPVYSSIFKALFRSWWKKETARYLLAILPPSVLTIIQWSIFATGNITFQFIPTNLNYSDTISNLAVTLIVVFITGLFFILHFYTNEKGVGQNLDNYILANDKLSVLSASSNRIMRIHGLAITEQFLIECGMLETHPRPYYKYLVGILCANPYKPIEIKIPVTKPDGKIVEETKYRSPDLDIEKEQLFMRDCVRNSRNTAENVNMFLTQKLTEIIGQDEKNKVKMERKKTSSSPQLENLTINTPIPLDADVKRKSPIIPIRKARAQSGPSKLDMIAKIPKNAEGLVEYSHWAKKANATESVQVLLDIILFRSCFNIIKSIKVVKGRGSFEYMHHEIAFNIVCKWIEILNIQDKMKDGYKKNVLMPLNITINFFNSLAQEIMTMLSQDYGFDTFEGGRTYKRIVELLTAEEMKKEIFILQDMEEGQDLLFDPVEENEEKYQEDQGNELINSLHNPVPNKTPLSLSKNQTMSSQQNLALRKSSSPVVQPSTIGPGAGVGAGVGTTNTVENVNTVLLPAST